MIGLVPHVRLASEIAWESVDLLLGLRTFSINLVKSLKSCGTVEQSQTGPDNGRYHWS